MLVHNHLNKLEFKMAAATRSDHNQRVDVTLHEAVSLFQVNKSVFPVKRRNTEGGALARAGSHAKVY